jgi:hypothetical protein
LQKLEYSGLPLQCNLVIQISHKLENCAVICKTQQFAAQHVSFWQHVMGTFLLAHVSTNINDHHYDHATMAAAAAGSSNSSNNDKWDSRRTSAPRAQVCFLFFAKQGIARCHTSNRLQVHMRKLRRQ